ncbi:hypothetical protein HNP40_002329 [Mycobacteroides chelonae]|nr:hypothetical protein [Mycobacteroides chelonae]
MNVTGEIVDQIDWHWTSQLRPRFDGLTDDEYFWEPVRGCWSLRPRHLNPHRSPPSPGGSATFWWVCSAHGSPVTSVDRRSTT